MNREAEVDQAMEQVYPEFRYRWCEAKACYCMGCVNLGGRFHFNKQDWEEWKKRNPQDSSLPPKNSRTS